MYRRELLFTTVVITTVSLVGCLSGGAQGPKGMVERFIDAKNDGDFDRVEELLYPDQPMPFSDDDLSFFEFADLQLQSISLISEEDDEALVSATYRLETEDGAITDEPEVQLKQYDGSWLVYEWDSDLAAH